MSRSGQQRQMMLLPVRILLSNECGNLQLRHPEDVPIGKTYRTTMFMVQFGYIENHRQFRWVSQVIKINPLTKIAVAEMTGQLFRNGD